MSASTALLCLILAITVAWALLTGGQLPRAYRHRTCQGKAWRREYPAATKAEIRAFLSHFASAFAFGESERLKLSPNDKVMEIYRALYPSKLLADALEVETLAEDLKSEYGFDLLAQWHEEVTLGQLFACTQASAARHTPSDA